MEVLEFLLMTYSIGFCVFANQTWWVTHRTRRAFWCGLIWPVIVFRFILEN